jgi:uncharacterized membrane protein
VISSGFVYLFTLAFVATAFTLLESKTQLKIFKYVPVVVMIYAFSMFLSAIGTFDFTQDIKTLYLNTKKNLLPAMLFLMLLQVDLRHFIKLGRSLIISYILAVFSIAIAFVLIVYLFDFSDDISAAFGALAGSWMGGTANMIAVGSALGVGEEAFAYALVVDSVNYTLWVMFLLFLVPFARYFNRFTKSEEHLRSLDTIGCACTVGAKHYWLFIILSIFVALIANGVSYLGLSILNHTTTTVIVATLFGLLGSFSGLRDINGSSEVATTMLYLLIALIGSHAIIETFSGLLVYVFAGFCILVVHGIIMILGAKIFKLDLFSIAVASLANIGGVASAPILAAAYNKSLVSVGVLMAIMGYLIGTFGGLVVGNILIGMG